MSSKLHHVCVTEFEVEFSPSRNHGIDLETETRLRSYGCELIDDMGYLLQLPQVAIATAQTLFHRFYCTESFSTQDVDIVSVASIFLAAKLEECMRSMRAAISVYCCIKFRRLKAESGGSESTPLEASPVLDMSTMFFYQLRQSILRAERLILEKLGFNTFVELPHKFLLNYLNVLGLAKNQELAQTAWNYMNDSMRTVACVRFLPEAIATAAIFRAASTLNISLHEEPTPWWTLFETSLEDIEHVCWLLTRLYANPTPKYEKVTENDAAPIPTLKEFVDLVSNQQSEHESTNVSKSAHTRTYHANGGNR